jgi:hypothetical protein
MTVLATFTGNWIVVDMDWKLANSALLTAAYAKIERPYPRF